MLGTTIINIDHLLINLFFDINDKDGFFFFNLYFSFFFVFNIYIYIISINFILHD